jgi:hypothetical protein
VRTVTIARKKRLFGVLMAVLASAGGRAAAVGFTPSAAVYADEKDKPLKLPEGVACNDGGNLVVADTGNARLVTYAVKVGVVTGGIEVIVPQLTMPLRVQFDSKGNLFALDGRTHKILRLDPKGAFKGFVEVKATSGTVVPASFKLDSADNVLLLEVSGRRVLLVDNDGAVLRTLPFPKGVITDVTIDNAGTIFAVDAVSATVFSAEKGATEFKAITKSMKDSMSFPGYITASKGKLYVVDQNGMGVVVLGQDGSYQGRQLSLGSNDGLVLYPAQLCMNGNAEAFIADRQNNRVQLFKVVQ